MEGTRYIEVPADALMGHLRSIGKKVTEAGGVYAEGVVQRGREVFVDLQPRGTPTTVRVFTSLAAGEDAVRGCGEDAVRLVIGYWGKDRDGKPKFYVLSKGRRVFRTAPTQLAEEARVQAFLGRFTESIRDGYKVAQGWLRCRACGAPMVERRVKATGAPFWGCSGYPECRMTAPYEAA